MVELEAELLLLGNWKNFEELEDNLSLAEVEAMLEALREKERRGQRFAASLKGIDLDENSPESGEDPFTRVQNRARAKLAGMSEERYELEEAGFKVTELE